MKWILWSILVMLGIQTHAQQFSFEIYLSDGNGHSDTIVLGYDPNASDSIDAQFGEVDIVSQPWDTNFEARISPYTQYYGPIYNYLPAFQSKKQILNYNPQPPYCSPHSYQYSSPVFIEVHSSTGSSFSLRWDSALFSDSSHLQSSFVPLNAYDVYLVASIFDSLAYKDWSFDSYYLQNNDTVWLLGFFFSSNYPVGIDENSTNQIGGIVVYPNPASEEVTVTFENPKFENMQADLKIYSLSGKLVDQKQFETINSFYLLNLSNLSNGVYLFHIELSNGLSQNGKLVILKQ